MTKLFKSEVNNHVYRVMDDPDYSQLMLEDIISQGLNYIGLENYDGSKVRALFEKAFADNISLLDRLKLLKQLDNEPTKYANITEELQDLESMQDVEDPTIISEESRYDFISNLSDFAYERLNDDSYTTIETLLDFIEDHDASFKWAELRGICQGEFCYVYGDTEYTREMIEDTNYLENVFFEGAFVSIEEVDNSGDIIDSETFQGDEDDIEDLNGVTNVEKYVKENYGASLVDTSMDAIIQMVLQA